MNGEVGPPRLAAVASTGYPLELLAWSWSRQGRDTAGTNESADAARPLLRRLLLAVSLLLALAAPAAAGLGSQKHAVDDRIADLHDRIAAAGAREQALTTQIDSVTTRIRSLEAQVGDVSARLTTLQDDLALHRTRLAKIQSLYQARSSSSARLELSPDVAAIASLAASCWPGADGRSAAWPESRSPCCSCSP